MLQEVIEKRKLAIFNLEEFLKEQLALSYKLNTARVKILEEIGKGGKPKFADFVQRNVELLKRKPKEVKRYNELEIDIEIYRLSIDILGQEINFLNTPKTKIEPIQPKEA